MNKELDKLKSFIIEGDIDGTIQSVRTCLDQGISQETILSDGIVYAMDEVGKKMQAKEFFIPDVLVSARAVMKAVDIFRSESLMENIKPIGKVVLATVEGDIHDIGKNLVKMMMECSRFEVIDLGVDVSTDKIIKAIEEHNPDIVGLSALLSSTCYQMEQVIEQLVKNNLRNKVKIMVGGAVVTQEYATEIGADAYSPDCVDAVAQANKLLVS